MDEHYQKNRCKELLKRLTYTSLDQHLNREPNHKVQIKGNIYNGTATLKQAARLYVQFCEGANRCGAAQPENQLKTQSKPINTIVEELVLRDSYERFQSYFDIKKKIYMDLE